eukprot:ctg_6909.g666
MGRSGRDYLGWRHGVGGIPGA